MMTQTPPDFTEPAFKRMVRDVVEDVTQRQNDKLRDEILQAVDRKNDQLRSDIATMRDEIVSELETTRHETVIDKSIHRRVISLEDDVEQLKKIHPRGTHTP